jgi:hypothetical protein
VVIRGAGNVTMQVSNWFYFGMSKFKQWNFCVLKILWFCGKPFIFPGLNWWSYRTSTRSLQIPDTQYKGKLKITKFVGFFFLIFLFGKKLRSWDFFNFLYFWVNLWDLTRFFEIVRNF